MTRNGVAASVAENKPHIPAILHRSGGAPASERNVCGICGEPIRRRWDIPAGEWVGVESETVECGSAPEENGPTQADIDDQYSAGESSDMKYRADMKDAGRGHLLR